MFAILTAHEEPHLTQIRALFTEYAAGLGISLCFQGFEQELAGLPGAYDPPGGALLLALGSSEALGCVGLRPLDALAHGSNTCEMKRLYVRRQARGTGLGRALAEAVIEAARQRGYERIRLDTLPSMTSAIRLYETLGFKDIASYCHNPHAGVRYLELAL